MSATNLAALLPSPAGKLVVQERAIPSPGPDELLIRNHAIALNPIDWKRQALGFAVASYPSILGADVSGVVAAVGPNVTAFQPGDRVLGSGDAMATANPDHAAFQTYTIVSAAVATKLPDAVGFAEGTSLPTAVGTATMALFDVLGLSLSSFQSDSAGREKSGILVWGGASSVGSAAIQLARLAGLKVFTTASPRHHDRVRALGAAAVVDYRSPTAVDELVAAAEKAGVRITLALDAVASAETLSLVVAVLAGFDGPKKVAHLLPWPEEVAKPADVEADWVKGLRVWKERRDLSEVVFNQLLKGWLETREVVPGTVRVVEGGVGGLQAALDELKGGVSGEKLVVQL